MSERNLSICIYLNPSSLSLLFYPILNLLWQDKDLTYSAPPCNLHCFPNLSEIPLPSPPLHLLMNPYNASSSSFSSHSPSSWSSYSVSSPLTHTTHEPGHQPFLHPRPTHFSSHCGLIQSLLLHCLPLLLLMDHASPSSSKSSPPPAPPPQPHAPLIQTPLNLRRQPIS